MPTYQYACTDCDHRFEAVQSFSDDALTDCPECAGRLRKVFNSVGIVFKGSGFYRTDSREKPADAKTGPSSGDSATSPAGSSSEKSGSSASGSTGSTTSTGSTSSTGSTTPSPSSAGSSTAGSAA